MALALIGIWGSVAAVVYYAEPVLAPWFSWAWTVSEEIAVILLTMTISVIMQLGRQFRWFVMYFLIHNVEGKQRKTRTEIEDQDVQFGGQMTWTERAVWTFLAVMCLYGIKTMLQQMWQEAVEVFLWFRGRSTSPEPEPEADETPRQMSTTSTSTTTRTLETDGELRRRETLGFVGVTQQNIRVPAGHGGRPLRKMIHSSRRCVHLQDATMVLQILGRCQTCSNNAANGE